PPASPRNILPLVLDGALNRTVAVTVSPVLNDPIYFDAELLLDGTYQTPIAPSMGTGVAYSVFSMTLPSALYLNWVMAPLASIAISARPRMSYRVRVTRS